MFSLPWRSPPLKVNGRLVPLVTALIVGTSLCCDVRYHAAAFGGVTRHPPNQARTGAIGGVVVDGRDGNPLSPTNLTLRGSRGYKAQARTDSAGRFLFAQLPLLEEYTLGATKPGYFDNTYGKEGLPEQIRLQPTAVHQSIRLTMWRVGAISGRVRDEQGEPERGAFVRVLRRLTVAGLSRYVAGPIVSTDDRGLYRIVPLLPGDYIVVVPSVTTDPSALPGSAGPGPATYSMLYFPASPTLDSALPITLDRGDQREGVDFDLQRVPVRHIGGRVVGPRDAFAGLKVRLTPSGNDQLGEAGEFATASVGQDGSFTFLNVPPGTYVVEARQNGVQLEWKTAANQVTTLPRPEAVASTMSSTRLESGDPGSNVRLRTYTNTGVDTHTGRVAVTIGEEPVTQVILPLTETASLKGRIVWDSAPPDEQVFIQAQPSDGDLRRGVVATSVEPGKGGFELRGLLAGTYVLRVPGRQVKSITWRGLDFSDRALDPSADQLEDLVVTLSSQTTGLMGTVRTAQSNPAAGAIVIVFPVDKTLWSNYGLLPTRLKAVRVSADGLYQITGLPAGEYYIAAMAPEALSAWPNPQFLARVVPAATRSSVGWGQTVSLDLIVNF